MSGQPPINVQDGSNRLGAEYGVYLQDEWKTIPTLTINFGGRFDVVDAYDHENQLSPRLNVVWEATPDITLHAGYARYFTPPPQEEDAPVNLNKFIGTTNEPEVLAQSPGESGAGRLLRCGHHAPVERIWARARFRPASTPITSRRKTNSTTGNSARR